MHPRYGLFATQISLAVAAITLFTLRLPLLAASGPPLRTGLWVMQKLPEDAATVDEFSIEVAALNVVPACGEYWELWHRDGFRVETSGAVSKIWQETKSMGYSAYQRKLISEEKYRQQR
jgi:hypothetical protein